MGKLVYDGTARLTTGDRELAHLQFVISEKQRRGEPFTFTWPNRLDEGGGRLCVWINASTSLIFTFDNRGPFSLNPEWLKVLAEAAHSPGGLQLLPEPEPEETTEDA